MRIVYFGGGSFAAIVLRAIAAAHEVALVITPPPAPASRKLKFTPAPAAALAEQLGLPYAHTLTPAQLTAAAADLTLVCDYGALLPPLLLEAAGTALNIHPSLLPRWRGAAPIERAILAGDAQTGVSIMQVIDRLDAGDVLAQQSIPLTPDLTGATLHTLLAEHGAALLLQVLADLPNHPPKPQDDAQATYAEKIRPADRELDFTAAAEQCLRQVQAFTPRPAAHFFIGEERLRVLAAEVVEGDAADVPAGTIIAADASNKIIIQCGKNALRITEVQRAGRNPMKTEDLLRGFTIAVK